MNRTFAVGLGRWMAVATFAAAVTSATPAFANAQSADDPANGPKKVLRYAFRIAETGFDPAQISDVYSRTVTPHIFEGLYQYDPLARPSKVRPLTASGMPEHSEDYRVWTVKLKPGIYFADDPAFKGQRRELTAEDYVYSFKRFADPKVNSQAWTWLETFKFTGLTGLREQALKNKSAFDYATPIPGIRALDRYTVRFELDEPSPRLITNVLVASDLLGAVAREVVELYGDQIMAHPVGTGPFKLVQWRRSSLIVLERNPQFREMHYEADPAPDDAEAQEILARLKGRQLPMIDRVEISIIGEQQPRWLTFLKEDSDLIEELPPEFMSMAMPHGKLAPNLAKRGMRGYRMVRADLAATFYNMDNPIVGGYTPDKIALRRAIGLAVDVEREIRLVRSGQAIAAQSPVMPNTNSYDPAFRSESSEYSPAKAKALLDMYGYVDRNGDGWRDMPDGSPLLLVKTTQPDQQSRQLDEEWRRNMAAIGIRIRFETAQWPENLKNARAGKLMMWGVGLLAADPDGQGTFQRYHSKQIDGQNIARFKLPEFDAVYERMDVLADGPERTALFDQAKRLAVAYAPYKLHVHRYVNDMAQPWLIGYRRPLFWTDFWQYLDIDTAKLPAK
jgi:ABC-type transport system substrate-binding protein